MLSAACHDTGSAVAGIPDSGSDWAFISSGTWSLVGAVLDEPCTTPAALRENFTNEGGVGGRIRFLKNVNGMWLLQECMREWTKQRPDLTLSDLLTECEQRPRPQSILPVDAPDLLLPGNMPARINRELESAGYRPIGGAAENAGEMANVIFFSLVELLCGFAPNYTVFLILRTIYGIGMGGEWGVGASLAMESAPTKWRGILSGIVQMH